MALALERDPLVNGRSNGAPVPRLRAAPKPSNAQAVHGATSTGTSDHSNSAHGEHPELLSPATSTTLSPTTPPYWINSNIHQRSRSNVSVESIPAGAITLQDNENNLDNDRNNACWARSVEIVDHIIVNGSTTNIGAFVVWIIKVETLTGSYMNIRKRYSEFDDFRSQLVLSFPNFEAAVPPLPPKSVISKFRPKFLEKRRAGLQYFLNCILLNPEFSGSPVLKNFLFK
ncbi:unnamed protein product [Clonostachys rhizophaga]|uniref:Endosomal/vacuolar adapter protein YPT35 n=1 Tax=Clonostachys rhizophaga TaxID=160324 RepID=A0A9N9YER9_9HYPO|nr:unnamed protein product [Clonostachys rhizophaga]